MHDGKTAADSDSSGTYSRRALLAGTAGLTVATSGCVRQVRSIVNRDGVDPLSLTITTIPADGDRESIRLARSIRSLLESAGIDVSIDMRSYEEFLRSVLVNHDYDVYVGQHPGGADPDFLYEALHSLYAEEAGWQNPFGFANLSVDELLEAQREAEGDDREEAVATALESIAVEQPFVPICVPKEHRLVRTSRFADWDGDLATRFGYLGLESPDDEAPLRAAYVDARLSENLNPLMPEYRDYGPVIELLYDSLGAVRGGDTAARAEADREDDTAARVEGGVEPWLAEEWEWTDGTLTVTLREDCEFHDGTPLDTDDVAFTYRFLADTTLGGGAVASPSPIYRGRAAAVDAVDRVDERTLEFEFETGEDVAEYALTVPILPEHVWRERSSRASVPGVRTAPETTDAVVTDNVPPIGSGPYRYVERSERDYVTLERFDAHFTNREDVDLPAPVGTELQLQIEPRSTSAVESVSGNDGDVTSTPLERYVVDEVAETAAADDDLELLESTSRTFYHLGFNTRRAPFGNPRFRRAVAGLIDKAWLIEDVFNGYAQPIATPVAEAWRPESLEWDGEDPETPFLGTDGEVDREAARAAFEDAGFRYGDDGTLRVRR